MPKRWIVNAILLVAAVESLLGLILYCFGLPEIKPPSTLPLWLYAVEVTAFTSCSALLILGGRRDPRAIYLGGLLLTTATAYTNRLLNLPAGPLEPYLRPLVGMLALLFTESFQPFLIWAFVEDFPRGAVPFWRRKLSRQLQWVSLTIGCGLFFLNAAGIVPSIRHFEENGFLNNFLRLPTSHYWTVVFSLMLPALGLMAFNARFAEKPERRRVQIFLTGLVLGYGPIWLNPWLQGVSPAYKAWRSDPVIQRYVLYFALTALSTVPVTTAYSVMVRKVLDVRLIIHKAVSYLLAKYTILSTLILPLGFFASYLYAGRDQTLSELFRGYRLAGLAAFAVLWPTALMSRQKLLNGLDRAFFRDQYDSRVILSKLIEEASSATTVDELRTLLSRQIDRALHVTSDLFIFDLDSHFVSVGQALRPLSSTSQLAALLKAKVDPIETDLETGGSWLQDLPETERQWLVDGTIHLLVPMHGWQGRLVGFLALGPKRSELPFSSTDRQLLAVLAASTVLAVENKSNRSSGTSTVTEPAHSAGKLTEGPANECVQCGLVQANNNFCLHCGGVTEKAVLPIVLSGKYRIERRIGAGGMGVVYRATELELKRPVAVKTLPRVSADGCVRLRREARSMVRVTHPNLAIVWTTETSQGIPALILELLDGGTLHDRLKKKPLPIDEALQLGLCLTGALKSLDDAGMLHGDIKPSNIGFTGTSVPKLLDFGLAHIIRDVIPEVHSSVSGGAGNHTGTTSTASLISVGRGGRIAGTPAYLSPEVIDGGAQDGSLDVWSLVVTLYEAICGHNPFASPSIRTTFERIRKPAPDIRDYLPECPAGVAEFFTISLSMKRKLRPLTADQLAASLQQLRHCLDAAPQSGVLLHG
jgi:hypothetical protein